MTYGFDNAELGMGWSLVAHQENSPVIIRPFVPPEHKLSVVCDVVQVQSATGLCGEGRATDLCSRIEVASVRKSRYVACME
jgi:hypothetical protein